MADLTHHDIDHLIADLREVTRPQVDQVPPHMKTMSELVAAMGGSRRRIEEMVRKAVESGRWCRKT